MTRLSQRGWPSGIRVALLLLTAAEVSPCVLLFAQDEAHGIREFTDSTTWRVPVGVTHIVVELWGAGGGGAAGTSSVVGGSPTAGGGGGGGGSGSYVRASVSVTPGESLTIRVGAAGAAGRADAAGPQGGLAGGDTLLLREGVALLVAKGGSGGSAPRRRGDTRGGAEGAGGAAERHPARLVRSGSPGARGHDGGLPESYSTLGGPGGVAVLGTVQPPGSFGGAGGAGRDSMPADGGPGGAGSVLITW